MSKKYTWLLCLLIFGNSLKSQTGTTSDLKAVDTIRIHFDNYYLHEKKISATKLEPLLNKYPPSALEYKAYTKSAVPGGFLILGSIVSGILAFTKINKQTHFWTPYSITQIGLLGIGIPIITLGNKHLKKAVRLYNVHVLND